VSVSPATVFIPAGKMTSTLPTLKDWANSNRHELEHRYFASIAELREWATPWFSEPVEEDRLVRHKSPSIQ